MDTHFALLVFYAGWPVMLSYCIYFCQSERPVEQTLKLLIISDARILMWYNCNYKFNLISAYQCLNFGCVYFQVISGDLEIVYCTGHLLWNTCFLHHNHTLIYDKTMVMICILSTTQFRKENWTILFKEYILIMSLVFMIPLENL